MYMNSQNILNFNGLKIDVRLDNSESYDLELTNDDYDRRLLSDNPIEYGGETVIDLSDSFDEIYSITLVNDEFKLVIPFEPFIEYFGINYQHTFLTTDKYLYKLNNKILSIEKFNEIVIDVVDLNNFDPTPIRDLINFEIINFKIKPWAQQIKKSDNFLYDLRTPKGWTMEFHFNKNKDSWEDKNVFFYTGVRGDNEIKNYADNSLSFGFTNMGEFEWVSTHLKNFCEDEYETLRGKTLPLNPRLNENFLISVVFDRYLYLYDCDIENEGGVNDYISDYATLEEELSFKWGKHKKFRLGDLKVYYNGKLIKVFPDWEEIVLSERGVQPYIMSWGGGTGLMEENHQGNSKLKLNKVRYLNQPLQPLYIKHNHINYYK